MPYADICLEEKKIWQKAAQKIRILNLSRKVSLGVITFMTARLSPCMLTNSEESTTGKT
jgi:hypothetical protein